MSGRKTPNTSVPKSLSAGFSSTPVKTEHARRRTEPEGLGDGVLSEDEDTFSLLSPIYHDSFDSDNEEEEEDNFPGANVDSNPRASPVRCELPKSMTSLGVQPPLSSSLSPWELWLLNKAKEDRLKLEKKVEEERLLKEQIEQQEKQLQQKRILIEDRIQEWLKIKREQEKQEQLILLRQSKEKMQNQQEKQKEIEEKAERRFKEWLKKKDQEKLEKEKKEKAIAAMKKEQEGERQRKANEKFKEWLAKANDKRRTSPTSPGRHKTPYHKLYPAPSFCNPIPWKPIHVPPPENSQNKTSEEKVQGWRKAQQNPLSAARLKNRASTPRQRRKK